MRYELKNVYVPSFSVSGSGDNRPTEELSFYDNKIAVGYGPTPDGVVANEFSA